MDTRAKFPRCSRMGKLGTKELNRWSYIAEKPTTEG